jgi:hypothetical protein
LQGGRGSDHVDVRDGRTRDLADGGWGSPDGCLLDVGQDGQTQDRERVASPTSSRSRGLEAGGDDHPTGAGRLFAVKDAPFHSPGDLDHLAGNVTADLVRRERHHGARHVLGPAQLAQRHRASHAPL